MVLKMKPILAVCHVYYPEMWAELKDCLRSIEGAYDLYVTAPEQNAGLEPDVKAFKADAHFEVVENKGYDVAPFIHVLKQVDLDKYGLLVKLHTKRDIRKGYANFRDLDGSLWRDHLLSFIRTKEVFAKYLKAFEDNPLIGMQANYKLIIHNDFYDNKARKETRKWLKVRHLPKLKYAFVGGTMFVARAEVFKSIQSLDVKTADFPDPKGEHKSQLAHIFERLLGYTVYKNGFILTDGIADEKQMERYHRGVFMRHYFINPIKRFFFQKKVTKSGKVRVKILKIPMPVGLFKGSKK